jgi:hypothetical protein
MSGSISRGSRRWLAAFAVVGLASGLAVASSAAQTAPASLQAVGQRQIELESSQGWSASVSGYRASTTLLVGLALKSMPVSTTFSVRKTAGVTLGFGYTSWTNVRRLTFTGKQADVNKALGSVLIRTGKRGGSGTLDVTVMKLPARAVFEPVGQHFYEFVATPKKADKPYAAAKAAAATKTLLGVQGHLVTITSKAENDFVSENIPDANNLWIAATDAPHEGKWIWDAGPEKGQVFWKARCHPKCKDQYTDDDPAVNVYSNWSDGEPNNYSSPPYSGEDNAVTNWNGDKGTWNDFPGESSAPDLSDVSGYVVEYSANISDYDGVLAKSTALRIPAPARR